MKRRNLIVFNEIATDEATLHRRKNEKRLFVPHVEIWVQEESCLKGQAVLKLAGVLLSIHAKFPSLAIRKSLGEERDRGRREERLSETSDGYLPIYQ